MSRKHHVTVEDVVDEEDQQKLSSRGYNDLDMDHINSNNYLVDDESRVPQRQAWEEVDALEEQARSEKLQNQSTAMANATQTARIVKEAQQSSGH